MADQPVRPRVLRRKIRLADRSLHILLAEDNKVNQLVACGILKMAGHSVEVAQDGTEVSPMLAAKAFDVVLMDVQMPKMDGFQATAAIRTTISIWATRCGARGNSTRQWRVSAPPWRAIPPMRKPPRCSVLR